MILGRHLLLDETIWNQPSISDSDLCLWFSDFIIRRCSFCVQVHFSATIRAGLMIIDQHLLLDGTIRNQPFMFDSDLSWSSDFALYLQQYQIGRHNTLDTCSVWHCEWPHTICRSLWPIFLGPLILPCISDLILQKCIIFKIPLQSDTMNDLIHFVGLCDAHLFVNLLCNP